MAGVSKVKQPFTPNAFAYSICCSVGVTTPDPVVTGTIPIQSWDAL
jgi:hypothetical protein